MDNLKATPGPWKAFNMINAESGERMTPDEVGEYVANAMRQRPECDDFLFVSAEKADGNYDVCHVGNGEDGPFNAALIAAAPELYEALSELDEAYCRAGGDLTREERLEDRNRLINARAALAKARGQ